MEGTWDARDALHTVGVLLSGTRREKERGWVLLFAGFHSSVGFKWRQHDGLFVGFLFPAYVISQDRTTMDVVEEAKEKKEWSCKVLRILDTRRE